MKPLDVSGADVIGDTGYLFVKCPADNIDHEDKTLIATLCFRC